MLFRSISIVFRYIANRIPDILLYNPNDYLQPFYNIITAGMDTLTKSVDEYLERLKESSQSSMPSLSQGFNEWVPLSMSSDSSPPLSAVEPGEYVDIHGESRFFPPELIDDTNTRQFKKPGILVPSQFLSLHSNWRR